MLERAKNTLRRRKSLDELRKIKAIPDAGTRLRAQGINISESPPKRRVSSKDEESKSFEERLEQGKREHAERESMQSGTKFAEIHRRDIDAEGAMVDPSSSFYQVAQGVVDKISAVVMQDSGGRDTEPFNLTVTRTDAVNAYTVRNGRSVFFESGIIVLFNRYLQEQKGYGISEDHLAAIHGHEIAHSHKEAQTRFLSEEYCDTYGLQIAARAGYNPSASIDLMEFLIWLEESEKQRGKEEGGDQQGPNIRLSHPNPKNRRTVLINSLHNSDTVMPNQAKPYTPIAQEHVKGVEDEMIKWQKSVHERVLPASKKQVADGIKKAATLSQLAEAMIGHQMHRKALIVKELATRQKFIEKTTLAQAFYAVVSRSHSVSADYDHKSSAGSSYQKALFSAAPWDDKSKVNFPYKRKDIVIGGMSAKSGDEPPASVKKEVDGCLIEMEKDLGGASIGVRVTAERTNTYENGKKLPDDEYKSRLERAESEAERKTKEMSAKVDAVYKKIINLNSDFNLAAVLAGDLSSLPADLQTDLKSFGIKNFDFYLESLTRSFRDLGCTEEEKSLQDSALAGLYPDGETIKKRNARMSVGEVKKLLDETQKYRIASIVESIGNSTPIAGYAELINDAELRPCLEEKVGELAAELSEVPQERELLKKLILNLLFKGKEEDRDLLVKELIASTEVVTSDSGFVSLKPYSTKGLSEALAKLRLAPACGNGAISSVVRDEMRADYVGTGTVERFLINVSRCLDQVRVYYHEASFERSGYRDVSLRFPPMDLEKSASLQERRLTTVPVFWNEQIKDLLQESDKKVVRPQEGGDPYERWNKLKQVAKSARYGDEYLRDLIFFKGIRPESVADYLLELVFKGETTLGHIFEVFEKSAPYGIESMPDYYNLGQAFLAKLPIPPPKSEPAYLFALFQKAVYRCKEDMVRHTKEGKGISQDQTQDQGKEAKEKLDGIFDFLMDGGCVGLDFDKDGVHNEFKCAGFRNEGCQLGIMSLLQKLKDPVAYLEEKIKDLFERQKGRLSSGEINKFISLISYFKQPGFYEHREHDPAVLFKLNRDGAVLDLSVADFDSLLKICEEIKKLPKCSYKDQCIWDAFILVRNNTLTEEQKEKLSLMLLPMSVSDFSDADMDCDAKMQVRIPRNEDCLTDAMTGFYLPRGYVSQIWYRLITNPEDALKTPFAWNYRNERKFKKMDSESIERTVLFERLKLLEQMSECPLKEALMLYGIQTALSNLRRIPDPEAFREELIMLLEAQRGSFQTPQSMQMLFELRLSLHLGGAGVPITPDNIRKAFKSADEFIDFICKAIPQKTAFRDTYIILAAESFPFKIGGAEEIRSLLFANDYGTDDNSVTLQRGGMELARSLKESKEVTPKEIREFVLWMADERRQVRSIDDFLKKLSSSEMGLKLLYGALGYDENALGESFKERIMLKAFHVTVKGLLLLPFSVKKAIVKLIFKMLSIEESSLRKEISKYITAGMPDGIRKIQSTISSFDSFVTFNSILDTSREDNPTKKHMFFDLVLGEKGLLEEPVSHDVDSFAERYKKGFEGSEMHKLLEDILQIVFERADFDENAKSVARVAIHSLIEGMPPVRRATVLYNLFEGISKIDFDERDKQKLRSKVLNLALSSIGILGVKMGQTDELMPAGWGGEMSSLKSGTKPISRFMVADIFRQEGLSGDYTIEENVAAASTACGYMVSGPDGQRQFVKVLRPEARLNWKEDFTAVKYMLQCLRKTGLFKTDVGPLVDQLQRLVQDELQTQKEVNNVLHYVTAETENARKDRGGIRAIRLPLARIGADGGNIESPGDSSLIFQELLPKGSFIELARLKSPNPDRPDYKEIKALAKRISMDSIHSVLVKDFLHRAFVVGVWHSDMHDGNIMVSRSGIVQRVVSENDLTLIDFGQIGIADSDVKRGNAARFLTGLAMFDRDEVALAVHEALLDKTGITVDDLKAQLPLNPSKFQEATSKLLAKYKVEEYLTNFLKASINVLPYLRVLPIESQFDLISPYMGKELSESLQVKIIRAVVKGKSALKFGG